MIGEIRDLETAQIAVQASLTGHLVLATLHTNDAAAAVTRLLDMGIEPFLLSSSLAGRDGPAPGAQAVRAFCKVQRTGYPVLARGGLRQVRLYRLPRPGGRVRTARRPPTKFSAQIHNQRLGSGHPHRRPRSVGMKTMREDGNRWLEDGTTTQAELLRVTKD